MEIPKAGQTVFFLGGPRFVVTREPVIRTETGNYAVCTVRAAVASPYARVNTPMKVRIHDDGTYENADFKSLLPSDIARWAWNRKTAMRHSNHANSAKARHRQLRANIHSVK